MTLAKLQLSPDIPIQQKKSGWLYIWVLGWVVAWLYTENPPDLPVQQKESGYQFPRTFTWLSPNCVRTFPGLSQDCFGTFIGLSQDFLRNSKNVQILAFIALAFFILKSAVSAQIELPRPINKHCENRKTLPWKLHIGCYMCPIALSKSSDSSDIMDRSERNPATWRCFLVKKSFLVNTVFWWKKIFCEKKFFFAKIVL